MKRKKCFTCKKKKFLFLFNKRPAGSYMRESDMGVSVNCKLCTFKKAVKTGEVFYSYTTEKGKRNFTTHKVSKWKAFLFVYFYSHNKKHNYENNIKI